MQAVFFWQCIFIFSIVDQEVLLQRVTDVQYIYANNETQIQFVNTQLDGVLTDNLNDTSNLNKISQAFNASVQLNELTFQPPEIKSKWINISIFVLWSM